MGEWAPRPFWRIAVAVLAEAAFYLTCGLAIGYVLWGVS